MVALVDAAGGAAAAPDGCPGAEQRLGDISERLRADARAARRWRWGWGLGYTAAAFGQGGLALTRDDRGERAELYVGAGKSALGLIPGLLVPVPAIADSSTLDQRLAAPAGDTRCSLLVEAESLLRRNAEDQAFARGWLAHALTVAANGGGLLVVGLGYQRWLTGVAGALVGTAIGELQIFTRPSGALHGQGRSPPRWALVPVLGPGEVGVRWAGELLF